MYINIVISHCVLIFGCDCSEVKLVQSVVMNVDKNEEHSKAKIKIPTIKAESETQTSAQLKIKSDSIVFQGTMETGQQPQNMSIRKRRNLSKNRGQAARQREKTPEPGRTPVPHEDTTTSDDEEVKPSRTSREIEADNTYEEMRRLVLEKANVKDPVYDLNTEEVLEARAVEANERRRRSISPFALPEKEDACNLERKGSFIDPSNKLLSTTYALTPKDEDKSRRGSLTIDPKLFQERKSSMSLNSTPTTASPKEKEFPYPLPTTPKKLEEIVYPDEEHEVADKKQIEKTKSKTPTKKISELHLENKKDIQSAVSPKTPEIPIIPGELITKVIQLQRTPSKKTVEDNKPNVEIRERIVRTPSRKISPDSKPVISKHQPNKISKDESKVPPVKPARSKSASRLGGKTSDSEMSEDQTNQHINLVGSRRKGKTVATPRRFMKNRSPKVNRSLSVNRAEDLKEADKSGVEISQTSREIIELMQKARARSLSIPKDEPKLLLEYKKHNKNLETPNKTPTNLRNTRGISCPKTIQIISDKEILSGLTTNQRLDIEIEKQSRHSSGYVDASQSEYTSSCYSTSPSENEFEFDLNERTAELTRKLNILSKEVSKRDATNSNILTAPDFSHNYNNPVVTQKTVLRKRSVGDINKKILRNNDIVLDNETEEKKEFKKTTRSKLRLLSNWQEFKYDRKHDYDAIKLLRNRCICDLFLLITICGLGGMMFKTLEGSFENAYKCGSRNLKRDFIESLWRGSHYLREEDWKSMARKKLYEFENQLHTAHEAGVTSYSGQRSWNFMNSFVYCLTLVSTIGYGHIAPKTFYGRIATIVYAIIGIPLFLIVLADFGKLFTRIIKFFWAFIRRFYYTRSCKKVRRTVPVQEVMKGLNIVYDVVRRPSQIFSEEDMAIGPHDAQPPPIQRRPSEDVPPPLPPKPGTIKEVENETEPDTPAPSVFEIDDEFNLPISVAIFILVVYIFIGAVGYNMWENWSFFESFYFVFISMSTIGLGDLVPDHPMFMMASILYLVFGLALTSMCINVVQVKLSNTFRQASAKLGATIGLKVAEEDGSLVPITPPPVEIVPVHKSKNEIEENKNIETKENDTKNR